MLILPSRLASPPQVNMATVSDPRTVTPAKTVVAPSAMLRIVPILATPIDVRSPLLIARVSEVTIALVPFQAPLGPRPTSTRPVTPV
jgi:hypothetical protein